MSQIADIEKLLINKLAKSFSNQSAMDIITTLTEMMEIQEYQYHDISSVLMNVCVTTDNETHRLYLAAVNRDVARKFGKR